MDYMRKNSGNRNVGQSGPSNFLAQLKVFEITKNIFINKI